MKKKIKKRLCIIISATMLFSLFLNYILQVNQAQRSMEETSQELFWQIGQILDQNEKEVKSIKADYVESCFIKAKAAAYIVENKPDVIGNQPELEKIAELLEIDEFHIFDTKGNLYAGSEPKYFGYNFNSGEQMKFFLPMLSDHSLKLCQEVTPNTAEQKMMQYAAVWREDGKGIVQIGMEPERVLEAMKKNELSYIFSLVTADSSALICAIDPNSHEILGSTEKDYVGQNIEKLGVDADQMSGRENGIYTMFDGRKSYFVSSAGDSVIFARLCTRDVLLKDVNRSSLMLAVYMLLMSVVMILVISRYLERYIVQGISGVNKELREITDGNLDIRVDINTTPEFKELSRQINQMIGSILESTSKLSRVLDSVSIPVAVYEYRKNMKRVVATRRIGEILNLTEEKMQELLADAVLFEKKLEELCVCPVDREKCIFQIQGDEKHFIRMESIQYEHNTLGILMDVTAEEAEKRIIRQERDIDLLTGLFSRRAFYRFLDELFQPVPDFEHCMILLADADGLKQVNDSYGHDNGDRYLYAIASILRSCPASRRILGRLGGDEFVMLITDGTSREELLSYVECIREEREQGTAELSTGQNIPVRFSLGCAFYPEDGTSYDDLIRIADERMYQEKEKNRPL